MNCLLRLIVGVALTGLALAPARAQERVTFNKDIAPILFGKCATCHRAGQSAPFNLMTYEDARTRGARIADVVRTGQMPPWKPEPGYGSFEGERRLTPSEIALFQDWVAQGMTRGRAEDLPSPPKWADGWQLGDPNLVVTMPEPYVLPSDGRDVFRTFVIPVATEHPAYVKAVEFRSDNLAVVHHANIKIDRTHLSRQWDENEAGPGYGGGGSREAKFPDGMFLGWTPGQSPQVSPAGMAWRLEPGSDLVVELHLMPGVTAKAVQVSVGFFFTDQVPSRTGYMLRLGRQDLDIAAGQQDYINADSYTLPVDVEALAVQPHAHFLAREIRSSARLPSGQTVPLIFIKDWNFHWQDVYRYSRPIVLPKGTTIEMEYTYDNSASNRDNPNRPPKRVTFGQTSASEMGSLWLQVVPRTPADLAVLERDFSPKILQDDIAGNEKWLEVEPSNAQLRAELAACYLEAGRFDAGLLQLQEAARLDPSAGRHYDLGRVLLLNSAFELAEPEFQRALQLNPGFSEALYGLAVAKQGLGNIDEAVNLYESVLKRDPSNVAAHYNLGRALAAVQKHARAIENYRKAIALAPEDADAHHALARALTINGQIADGIYHYRRTLEIEPNRRGALLDLAWILATSTDPDLKVPSESVRLAERAVALTNRRDATALDTLAAAYAAAGQIDRAISTAENAVDMALESGELGLAAEIRTRVNRYRSRK